MVTKAPRTKSRSPTKDWEKIKADYTKTDIAIRALAKRHGVSHVAIIKRATAEKWARVTVTIKGRASVPVTGTAPPVILEPPRTDPTLPPLSAVAAMDPAEVASFGIRIVASLMAELDAVSKHGARLAEMIASPDAIDNQNALQAAVTLPVRSAAIKTLGQAVKLLKEVDYGSGKKAALQAAASRATGTGKYATPNPPRFGMRAEPIPISESDKKRH